MNKGLSPKKKKFINEYLVDLYVSKDYKNERKENKENKESNILD